MSTETNAAPAAPMIPTIRRTSDDSTQLRKMLLTGFAGAGKTTQLANYKEMYGDGIILSGEAGLSVIGGSDIPYIPFISYDGPNTDAGWSFKNLARWILSDDFKARGYKWIGLDSLTELSDLIWAWAQTEAAKTPTKSGATNKFDVYAHYNDAMIRSCKFIRNLPLHVCMTSLVKESVDDNGAHEFVPLMKSMQVSRQLAGLFDLVWGLVKESEVPAGGGEPIIKRYVVTDEVAGWQCKSRDPLRVLRPIENTDNVCDLLHKIDSSLDEKRFNSPA